ncbi:MAG: hydroxymethylglutaryl-CoA lyase [Flavobacteriaceae bacterium]|nr:hydroxymethylglutaryl-CoA lyase [Flavobacteriaceae bacterium]
MESLDLVECPRDAMQGVKQWISTEHKIQYAQALLKVGFSTLDIGSFVSPKAIPQMRDTAAVLNAIDRSESATELLTIVANVRGAIEACAHSQVDWLGYPFSISENFQMRNTHKTIGASKVVLEQIIDLAQRNNKKLVVYLSMGFGNPYGDPWSPAIVSEWVDYLASLGVTTISLSDTVGTASTGTIEQLFTTLIPAFPNLLFGAHLHTRYSDAIPKVDAAYSSGCRRFDTAIKGYGGCPMAKDELVGNLPTEKLLSYLSTHKIEHQLNPLHFESAYNQCLKTFI